MQGHHTVATCCIGQRVGRSVGACGIGIAVDPIVAVACHLLVDTGAAMVDGQMQGHHTVASCRIGQCVGRGVGACGISVAVNPIVAVACCHLINAIGGRNYGEGHDHHRVAAVGSRQNGILRASCIELHFIPSVGQFRLTDRSLNRSGRDWLTQRSELHFIAPSALEGCVEVCTHSGGVGSIGREACKRKRDGIGRHEMVFIIIEHDLPCSFGSNSCPSQVCRGGGDVGNGKIVRTFTIERHFHIIKVPVVGSLTMILESKTDGLSLIAGEIDGVGIPFIPNVIVDILIIGRPKICNLVVVTIQQNYIIIIDLSIMIKRPE